jgi:hypothetical protein
MTIQDNQRKIGASKKSFASTCLDAVLGIQHAFHAAAYLGLSYLGLFIATSFARKLADSCVSSLPRKY